MNLGKKYLGTLCIILLAIILNNCEYDVTKPQWDQDYENPPIPTVTGISPSAATPGVDYITITGTNFLGVLDSGVYFGTTPTQVLSASQTEVVVRRPNTFGDSLAVKVIPSETDVTARYSLPYKVDRVVYEYGEFTTGTALDVLATDAQDNLYVIMNVSTMREIWKVAPSGEKTMLSEPARRDNSDLVINPDGILYLIANNRAIDALDLNTGTYTTNWVRLPQGQVARTGDLDGDGNFYAAGRRTAIHVIDPSLNITPTTYYAEEEVWGVRVHQNNLYVLVQDLAPDAQNPEWAVWKHTITSGSVGTPELLLDLTQEEISQGKEFTSMEISVDGDIFIATEGNNSLLKYDVSLEKLDYAYKNILPSSISYFKWGTGTSIYAIVSDDEFIDPDYPAPEFDQRLFRIDLGVASSQK